MTIRRPKFTYILALILALTFLSLKAEEPGTNLSWTFKTSGPVYASALVSDGVVYIGSLDSLFYAIDAFTGEELWRLFCGNQVRSSAARSGKLLFVQSGNRLMAVSTRGKVKWERELYEGSVNIQQDPWDFHHSSPCVHEGRVYIGTEQGLLLGFDARSGERILRCQTLSEKAIRTTPVVSGNLVMYGDWDGVFFASDRFTGEQQWKYDSKKDGSYPWVNAIHGSPLVQGDQVFFTGRSCRLYALDVRSGKKNWQFSSPTDQWLLGGPQVSDGAVYLGSSDQGLFHAIDASTGNLLWTTEMDCRTWGKASVEGEHVFIGSNSFYVLDRKTGEKLRQFKFPQVHEDRKFGDYVDRTANFHSSPLVYEGMAIIGSDDGSVYAIKLGD